MVFSGKRPRPAGAAAPQRRVRHFAGAFVIEIPNEAVQSGVGGKRTRIAIGCAEAFILLALFFFLGKVANHFARRIENVERNFGSFAFGCFRIAVLLLGFFLVGVRLLQRSFQPIVDHRASRGILAGIGAGAEERAAEHRVTCRGRSEQIRGILSDRVAVLFKRCDVIKHPEAAAVCGDNQVVVLHHEIVHR